jgi:hypothetical protein
LGFFYLGVSAFCHFLGIWMITLYFINSVWTFRHPSILQRIHTEIPVIPIPSITHTTIRTLHRYFLSLYSCINFLRSTSRCWYIMINFLILSKFIRNKRPFLSIYFIF